MNVSRNSVIGAPRAYQTMGQASVALCIVVQSLRWGGTKAIAIPFETKSGYVRIAKNIAVFDSAKKQQKALSTSYDVPMFRHYQLPPWKEGARFIAAKCPS
jgi:hypothetical protein